MENSEHLEKQEKKKGGVPIGLPIAGIILLILGLVAMPLIQNNATEEQLARNVLLSALPFILIFAAIIIAFMSLIWFAMSKLNGKISPKIYRPIDFVLIAGIVFGMIFMFQPWFFPLFKIGFFILLASTLGYILWSHVKPKEVPE
jgi:uncharacterized membrane protein